MTRGGPVVGLAGLPVVGGGVVADAAPHVDVGGAGLVHDAGHERHFRRGRRIRLRLLLGVVELGRYVAGT